MAVVAASTNQTPSPSGEVDGSNKIGSGLICGEDLTPGAACFIASDGKVYMSGGSGVTALTDAGAVIHGYAPHARKSAQGMPVTLVHDVDFGYGASLTPGQKLYLDVSAATKGRLNTSQGITALPPCAHVIDDQRIRVFRCIPYAIS
jgi:hypothetical protein